MARGSNHFQQLARAFKRQKRNLPKLLGNSAKNHFVASFRVGGFTDNTLKPWKPRKHPNAADTRTGKTRALLVDSGNLRKSIRVKSSSFRRIRVGSYGIPYAQIHNRGGVTRPRVTPRMRGFMRHQFRKTGNPMFAAIANTKKERLTVEIPKRQFIGRSAKLRKKLSKIIGREIRNVLTQSGRIQ